MKTIIGVILIIIGYLSSLAAVVIHFEYLLKMNNFKNYSKEEFNEILNMENNSRHEELPVISIALLFIGALLFIIGIILATSKTKKQRQIEFEHKILSNQVNLDNLNNI